jgi:integrase
MFALAGEWGFVSQDFVNPARGIKRFGEYKRDRWISPRRITEIAQAIEAEPNIYVRMALWLYLLTGIRKSELLGARWEDIDWQRQELRLGETKARRIHYVPLSAPAIAILRDLPRIEGSPYLLPGHVHGRPLENINKSWERIRKAAGVEDVRLHDLRRTVGSWLAPSGNSLHLVRSRAQSLESKHHSHLCALWPRSCQTSTRGTCGKKNGCSGQTPGGCSSELKDSAIVNWRG